MRILIDECLDWRLKREFPGHLVVTVHDVGRDGLKNGVLLGLAELQFDVFVTADKNVIHQQTLPNFTIAVVVLDAVSTRLQDTAVLVPKVLAALPGVAPGTATLVSP